MENAQLSEYSKFIINCIRNKEVLDLGSIGHDFESRGTRYDVWLFDLIKKNSKSATGLDYLNSEVIKAQRHGYNIIHADAQNFNIHKNFDVIVAGDIIEHLSNPGLFVESCKRHLKNNGSLIISTPNTYSAARLMRVLIYWTNNPRTNAEHTFYFTPQVLDELLRRYGFRLVSSHYFHTNLKQRGWNKFLQAINNFICAIIGNKFSESMVRVYGLNNV